MKCGSCNWKDGFFKVYAPILHACVKKGIEIIVYKALLSDSPSKNAEIKAKTLREVKELPFCHSVNLIFFSSLRELEGILQYNPPDFLVVYETNGQIVFQEFESYHVLFGREGIPIFSVQWTFEMCSTLSPADHGNPKYLESRKLYFCYSEFFKEYYRDLLKRRGQLTAKSGRLISETFVPVNGSPILDTIRTNSDKTILDKYRLPHDRRLVLFFPPNISGLKNKYRDPWFNNVFSPMWRITSVLRIVWCWELALLKKVVLGVRYLDLLKAMKIFCERNNAFLVIKVREKNTEMNKYRKYCDRLVSDESMYPFTSVELLQVSSLAIQFVSSGIFECVAAGVPNITIVLPFLARAMKSNNKEQFYDDGLTIKMNPEQFARDFPHRTIDDFRINRNQRDQFIQKYLGGLDSNSSNSIVTHILDFLSREKTLKIPKK